MKALRFEAVWTFRKIAENQGLGVSTVHNICTKPTTPKKRKGHPVLIYSPIRHRLIFTATESAENHRKSFTEIAEISCEKTLRKAFATEGYTR